MKPMTEQRRQEIIEFINLRMKIANDDSNMWQVYELALASLNADAFGEVCGVIGAKYDVVRFAGQKEIHHGDRVYTAPPVPVIKLPDELTDLVNAVDFYNAVKAENPKVETGTWKDADEWIKRAAVTAAPLVKRLNGLGE